MLLDAIVLAGGRSSRLSGTPKAGLLFRGRTLVAETVRAVVAEAGPARLVVVGGDDVRAWVDDAVTGSTLLTVTREQPAFGGPAAGIGAGLGALDRERAGSGADAGPVEQDRLTVILACDVPLVAEAIPALLASVESWSADSGIDGVCATDEDGRDQYLLGIYRTTKLRDAVAALGGGDSLTGLSVRALLRGMTINRAVIPAGTGADVDTWADAARFGITAPDAEPGQLPDHEQAHQRPTPQQRVQATGNKHRPPETNTGVLR